MTTKTWSKQVVRQSIYGYGCTRPLETEVGWFAQSENGTQRGPFSSEEKAVEAVEFYKAAAALGRKGGSQTSERKARTSAENGRKGGRPKKQS